MAEPSSRLRVLLIAEACNPGWSSVPLVGYNFARALAERPDLDITIVTHIRNQQNLAGDPLAGLARIEFLDTEWVTRPIHRLGKLLRGGSTLSWTTNTALAWPGYMAFESALHDRFRRDLARGQFDLIHRVTPLSPTIPSPLAAWTRVPMLLGPLNGGLPWPAEYPQLRSREREWLVPLRSLYRSLPFYRSCYRRLAGVIAGSRHTATEVPTWFRGKRFYLPENGVDPTRFPLATDWPKPRGPFRFITVGRLVPYKGVDLTLSALAGSPLLRQCQLWVVGEGPERANLEAMAREQQLLGGVQFKGWLDQKELSQAMAGSQALVFPSLREFGGGVVLEAMASGLPGVVVAHGGPAELITPECGVALPLAPREELVLQLRKALENLVLDPARTQHMGEAACQRVRSEFTWDTKADRLVSIYRRLLERDASPCSTLCC